MKKPVLTYLTLAALAIFFVAIGLRIGSMLLARSGGTVIASGDGTASLSPLGDAGKINASSSTDIFKRIAGTPAPRFSARAAIVADPKNQEILFTYNSGMRWPLASLTKLMTAHVVLSRMDLERTYQLASSDFELGSSTNLTRELAPGAIYSGTDLLRIMLVSSSNEAAEAFARSYGRAAFIAEMNKEAKAWGFSDTTFVDPSGLGSGNTSTPKEFAMLAMNILKAHPEMLVITKNPSILVEEVATGSQQVFQSTNQLAMRSDFLGGKTGTTPEAGENLLVLFSYRSRPVMILLFGSEDRFNEAESLLNWFTHDFIPGN